MSKLHAHRWILVTALAIGIFGCGLFEPEEQDDPLAELRGLYLLNEGVFGANNASLWHLSSDWETVTPNVYLAATGEPLGDTGQSLLIAGQRLYIVVNGTSTLEIMDLSTGVLALVASVDLNGASPRDIAVLDGFGYIASWNLAGLLVLDLTSLMVTDTIPVGGWPEDVEVLAGKVYAAVPYGPGFSANDVVVEIDPATAQVTHTWHVGPGPLALAALNGELMVSRQWFSSDFLTSYRGLSIVVPGDTGVTVIDWGEGGGADLFVLEGVLYAATSAGAARVNADGSLNTGATYPAAALSTPYLAATDGTHIIVGSYLDFASPGMLKVYAPDGSLVESLATGIGPGAVARY